MIPVTATVPKAVPAVTDRRPIRPPDPAIVGPTLAYMPIASHETTRCLLLPMRCRFRSPPSQSPDDQCKRTYR